ncbi:MAG: response regulator [Lachnospiraceae bacterium]|nr:response regulator [Lachnospiraceae bacterium]
MASILFIRKEKNFMTGAITGGLTKAGFEITEESINVDSVQKYKDECALILFYTDGIESLEDISSMLVYLKDLCLEENKLLYLIGDPNEFSFICKTIPKASLCDTMARPLDMNRLIDDMNKYTSSDFSQKKNLLVVDDDATYLKIVREWLKNDYNVTIVSSAMQAITYMSNNHVDLLLLDYEMPITNGPKVYEMMKSDPEISGIPVMFLTGKNDFDSIIKVMSLKPAGYLLKTINKSDLIKTLKQFFVNQKYGK